MIFASYIFCVLIFQVSKQTSIKENTNHLFFRIKRRRRELADYEFISCWLTDPLNEIEINFQDVLSLVGWLWFSSMSLIYQWMVQLPQRDEDLNGTKTISIQLAAFNRNVINTHWETPLLTVVCVSNVWHTCSCHISRHRWKILLRLFLLFLILLL